MKFISAALAFIVTLCHQDTDVAAFITSSPSSPSSVPIQAKSRVATFQKNQVPNQRRQTQFQLFSTETNSDLEQEIKSMRVSTIKQELESYGISTKTFLEKSELVDALVQARREGKTSVTTSATSSTASDTTTSATSSSSAASTSSSTTTKSSATPLSPEERQQRIQTELEKCKSLKVSELKSELESYGINPRIYLEKSEFVKAVAEARVDGVQKKSKKKKRRVAVDDDEVEEVTAKVEVITNDSVGPKTKKTRDASSSQGGAGGGSPFGGGAGGSPFGAASGGGSPFGAGGMGGMDMGNIADMLKGMGGMGGGGAAGGANPFAGGANPFAGAAGAGGGNPFGGGGGMDDAMKAAQQAMSNPKVQAVIAKAQKNPKVMQAVQECMGNPMAMTKYMSDPEVGPILKELQEAMM